MAATRAVSLRLLTSINSSYAGACIRVQRSSDSTQQDIGFVAGSLDVASLISFVGSDTGIVVKWYDQSGNANDWTATASAEPVIVSSGALQTQNGKPAIRVDVGKQMTSTAGTQAAPLTTLAVSSHDVISVTNDALIEGAPAANAYWYGLDNANKTVNGQQAIAIAGVGPIGTGVFTAVVGQSFAGGFQHTGAAYSYYANGALDATGADATAFSNTGGATLFPNSTTDAGRPWQGGTCQEVVEWNTANGDTANKAFSQDQYAFWVAPLTAPALGFASRANFSVQQGPFDLRFQPIPAVLQVSAVPVQTPYNPWPQAGPILAT